MAGTGIPPSPGAVGPLGANGPATKAQIGRVYDLTIDAAGYVVFISDFNQLRRITPAGGIDYYPSCTACSDRFLAAAADSMGNLYTSDGSHLYRISSDGVVHNFAGFGNAANNGNGEPAIDAPPSQFIGLAADSAGNVYTEEQALSSAASSPFVIRRIGTDGIVNIVAGTFTGGSDADGPALQVYLLPNYSRGMTAGANGTLNFAEGNRVRQLTKQSMIRTIAGGNPRSAPDGAAALDAWFIQPGSMAFDRAGNLYAGQTCIIQKIDSQGVLSNVAGTGECSTVAPSGPALATNLDGVVSIAADSQGQIYFADFLGSIYTISTQGVIGKIATITDGISPSIAVDSQGRVYFVTLFGLFGRILPGKSPQIVVSIPSQLVGIGIAVDAADNVYICCDESLIDRYSPDLDLTRLNVPGYGYFPVSMESLSIRFPTSGKVLRSGD